MKVIFQPVDRSDHLFPWTEGRTHLLCLGLELRVMQNLNKLKWVLSGTNIKGVAEPEQFEGELSDTKEPSNLVKELRYFWSCDIGEVHGSANS